jgi:hypothetical protein
LWWALWLPANISRRGFDLRAAAEQNEFIYDSRSLIFPATGAKPMRVVSTFINIILTALIANGARAAAIDASPPRQVALQIYDTGRTLAAELRHVISAGGDVEIRIKQLPARLDPTSVTVSPIAGGSAIEVLQQRFEYDLADPVRLLRRYLDRPVVVGRGAEAQEGRLIGLPVWREAPYPSDPLVLAKGDGSLVSYLTSADAGRISFPDAGAVAVVTPTLFWSARIAEAGQQNFRLNYQFDGLSWRAVYDVILSPDAGLASLQGRIVLENRSGGSFQDASISLIETERGRAAGLAAEPAEAPPQRYAYGFFQPREEREIATLAPAQIHVMDRKVSLADGETVFLPLASVPELPVRRIFVYDGVRFDRFQRNRRSDWNYGTEFHTTVDTHLEFDNTQAMGLGLPLPPGRLRLYQRRADGSIELTGEEVLAPVLGGASGHVRLGPARGLRGERERTGYTEVRLMHEYEESFEIRLSNDSDQAAEIRVVEHLYRWPEYEIVKSDAEYQPIGPQTIEFRTELKPGGRRAIHYTVRYRW